MPNVCSLSCPLIKSSFVQYFKSKNYFSVRSKNIFILIFFLNDKHFFYVSLVSCGLIYFPGYSEIMVLQPH